MRELDYTPWFLYLALAVTAIITGLWFAGYMVLKSALEFLGLCWSLFGSLILVAGLFFQYMALFRLKKSLLEQEKAIPTEWWRRFPVAVAFCLGPKEPREYESQEETYSVIFWGLLLLLLGFLLQAVSFLPLESNLQSLTLTVSPREQGAPTKQWVIGLFLSLVVGGFLTWLFLEVLRRCLRVKKPEGISVPPWLTGAIERLFFTVVIGVRGAEQFTSDIPTTMVAWLALKLATNWNLRTDTPRAIGFSALLAGVISMFFAFLGGLVCRGELSLGL